MAGNFTDSEKILYSLKYALLKATVDPENPDYLEPVAPPRVFPTNVMSQSLIENGVGDINANGTYGGAASISGTVDLTKPWNIVKWYYIIDPTTNVITGNTVNDAITTQAVAETLPSGATSGSAASSSTSYTYYQEYFYGGNVPNATGVPSARTDTYKGLRLAYSKATIGTVCAEGNANLVPHISLYLQAPTSWVSPSGTKGDGDNWSYRNPHFRNLLGSEVGFEVSVNSYESGGKREKIGYNTAGTATEFFWYTQASYGLLSFYGQTTSGFGGDGQSNKPYLTFCRYIGESGTLGGGGGGGGATTLNALTDVTSSGATDGQALVWDNTASNWKPGSVAAASGGGGGTTAVTDGIRNISDTNQYHGYIVSGSSTLNGNPHEGPHQAFRLTEAYNNESTTGQWNSAENNYNSSSGAYTGSQTTSGYGGEWLQINFGKKANVYHYHITPEYTVGAPRWKRAPKEYKVFGSNDGTTWVEVHSGSATSTDYTGTESPGANDYGIGLVKTNTLSTSATYQYFRLVINKHFGGDNYCGLMYLAFYGAFPDDIATIGDLSGVDLTTTAPTSGQALVWDDTNSKWKPGSVAASGGGGGGGSYDTVSLDRKGQVLETLAGVCDGRSVTVESGTYTLPVGTKQALSGDPFVDINGTNISYKPPSGTKQVVYSMLLHLGGTLAGHSDQILNFVVYLDGNEITNSLITERPGQEWGQGWFNVQFVFDIGNVSSDDYTNGKLASWDTHKIIKVMGREGYPGSYGGWINSSHNVAPSGGSAFWGYGAGQVYPQMTIKAIGDESISVGVSALTKENSLTIPNFTGTYTTNKLYNQSDRLKFNGETILTSNNPTINLKGQVLETLTGVCDGRTIAVASGTYTLGDSKLTTSQGGTSALGGQVLNETWQDVRGSSISYKPPTGTKQVIFKFNVSIQYNDPTFITFFKLNIDTTDNLFFKSIRHDGYADTENTLVFVIDIGSEDDSLKGKFLNWSTPKTLKLQARNQAASNNSILFQSAEDENSTATNVAVGTFIYPSLEIQAIGEGLVGVQKVVNVLGPGGIRNISDLHMYPDYEITWSSDYGSGSGNQYGGNAAFYSQSIDQAWHSGWITDAPKYNTTTGVYTGSSITGTLAGEWLQINFKKKATIHKIGLQHLNDEVTGIWSAPKTFVLFGSNDGTTFNNVGQFSVAHLKEYISDTDYDAGNYPTTGSRLVYRALSTPQTYQYFRLVVTSNFGNHTNYSEFTASNPDGSVRIAYLAYYGTLESEYANIGDLSDVSDSVSTAATGQTLIYNGSEWAPGAATASGSVVVSTAFDGGGALKLTEFSGTSTTSKLYNDTSSGENVLKFDGKTVLTGEGINRRGQVLETLVGIFDGRNVQVASGTYTLTDVTTIQTLTGTASGYWTDHLGTDINYKPPSGTRQVKITYTVGTDTATGGSDRTHPRFRLVIDGVIFTSQMVAEQAAGTYMNTTHNRVFILDIGSVGTDDIANGKLASWSSAKQIKLQVGTEVYTTSYNLTRQTTGAFGVLLLKPSIEIQAIGEGVVSVGRNITAITRNLKRRISHPDDGLVLAYHTDGDGTYISSYPLVNMFKYVGSSTGISDVGGHSENNYTSANSWNWTTAQNPAFNATVAPGIIGPYVGAQFSEKFVFTSIRILPRVGDGYAHSCPRVFYIYGSNDRTNWDLIFSKSLPSITVSAPSQTVGPYTVGSYTTWEIPDNGVGYKNFHMIVANTYPVSNYTIANFNIIDLSIYGYEADITASIANLKDVDTISTQPEIGQGLLWNGNKWVPGKQVNEGVALDGQVLETLAGVCDGHSIDVASGTYMLPNVTAIQDLNTTWTQITGSQLLYKPPPGTKQVIYKFAFLAAWEHGSDHSISFYDLFIDNIRQTNVHKEIGGTYPVQNVILTFVLQIGVEEDTSKSKFGTWNSEKKLEVRGRQFDNDNNQMDVHSTYYYTTVDGNYTSYPKIFSPPTLTVQAIGNKLYQPAQIVRTLEGGDGTKNISDTEMYSGYVITNSTSYSSVYQAFKAFRQGGAIQEIQDCWLTAATYVASTGAYNGSVTTNGYTGEWAQINFGKKVKVYSYQIGGRHESGGNYKSSPKDYKLFGSNDGSTWADLHTGAAVLTDYGEYDGKRKNNVLSTPTTYQYFRFVLHSIFSGAQQDYAITDYLGFYGSFFDEVGISKKVSDLIDVDLTAPSDGEALIYDASIGKWKPGGNAALNFAPNVVINYNTDTSQVAGHIGASGCWRRFGVAEGVTTGGLEVTIKPTTLTSKIKLSMSVCYGISTGGKTTWMVRIIRTINGVSQVILSDNTDNPADNTTYASAQNKATFLLSHAEHTSWADTSSYEDIDEPNTLLPVTYHIQVGAYASDHARDIRWNRSWSGGAIDSTIFKSTLIAEEVMGSKALVSHNGYSFNMQPDLIFANRLDTTTGLSNKTVLPGWETPLNFPIDTITNTNTSVYSYNAGKITVLQDGYYKAIFRVGASDQNTTSGDHRLASAAIAISTDGGASYTTPSFNYAGGNVDSGQDYGSSTCNVIVKLNKNDIIICHGRGNMWNDSTGFSVERLEGTQPLTQEGALVLPEFTGTDTTNRLYAENGLLKFNGKAVDNHSVKNRKGQVLEILKGRCDGSTVTVDSGTYTMPVQTFSSGYKLPTSMTADPASLINYKAPNGTDRIIFKYKPSMSFSDARPIVFYQLCINDTFIDSTYTKYNAGDQAIGSYYFEVIITKSMVRNITSTNKYQFHARSMNGSNEAAYYSQTFTNNTADVTQAQDYIEITAIGDAAIQNATAVAGNSMVHFNGNSSSRNTVTRWNGSTIADIWNNYTGGGTGYNFHKEANFGGCMNKSTGVFTVPHAGLYLICCSGTNTSSSSRGLVYIELISDPNGRYPGDANPDMAIMEIPPSSTGAPQAGSSITLYLYSGDAIGFRDWNSGSAIANFNLSITALQDQVPQTITARPGMTLETLAGVCDGRSITVASGTYTLENVTGRQNGTATFTPITGSKITYKPPTGTKQVIYEFTVHVIPNSDGASVNLCGHYKMYLGGTEVEIMYNTHQLMGAYPETDINIQMIINIGEKNDIANAHILNWDTPLELRVDGQQYDEINDEVTWHKQYYFRGVNVSSDESKYQHPNLKITAIGDGPGIRPASGGNVVTRYFDTQKSITIPYSVPGTHIPELDLVITPTSTDSVIELKFNLFCEFNENVVLRVLRNDELVVPAADSKRGGLQVAIYDNNDDSTANVMAIRWYDQPNTINPITYKLYVSSGSSLSAHDGQTGWLNRPFGGADGGSNESGVSNSIAIEHNKHARPYDEDGALTIPTFTGSSTAGKLYNDGGTLKFDGRPLGHKVLGAKGQILETLEGLCDGRTVIGASGTYTLPTAAHQVWSSTDHALKDVDASIINYKPPGGTTQVIYEFRFMIGYTGSTGSSVGGYNFYIAGNQIGHAFAFNTGRWESNWQTIKLVVDIGENDEANNKILDWNSPKQIKVMMAERESGSNSFTLHKGRYNTSTEFSFMPASEAIDHPTIKITAIGDGPSYSPATGTNMVNTSFSTALSLTAPASIPGIEIEPARIVIKPTATDSVIELRYSIFLDANSNTGFRITRNINGTDVLVVPASNNWEGLLSITHGDDDTYNTVPTSITTLWYDEPNTTSEVTYKLWIGWTATSGSEQAYINRTAGGAGGSLMETGVSTGAAIEHAKRGNPLDAEHALSIPEFAGSDPDNKLYNNGGVLHFNGNPVGSGGIMMQFEDTNLLSHQGSYTLKHNETNFCVANENAQLSTFRLTQIGSSGTGKYNVSVVVKNNNAGKLTAIKEQSSTVTVIPIENIYTKVRYQTEPTRDSLIEWFPLDIDEKDAISRTKCMEGGDIVKATNYFDSKFDGDNCYSCGSGIGTICSPSYKWSDMGKFTITYWWKHDNVVNDGSGYFTFWKFATGKHQSGNAPIEGIDETLDYGMWIIGLWDATDNYYNYYAHISGSDAVYINNNTQLCKVQEWNHFAFVYNSSTDYTMYFNGVATPVKPTNAITLLDGTRNNWTGVYDHGNTVGSIKAIKDYRVYDRALSAGELAAFQSVIKDTNAGGLAIGNIKPPINLTKNELVSVEVRPIGGEHNKYTTKVNVDLMGNSGTVLDGTSKWDNDTQGISYSAGNVGIGILNPSEKLSISDNVRIDGVIKPKGTSGTPGQSLSLSDDGLYMEWKNVGVSGLTSLNGNIGIGTTSPNEKLDISADVDGNNCFIQFSQPYQNYGLSDGWKMGGVAYSTYTTSGYDFILKKLRSGTTGNVLIPDGNVGIGTTSVSSYKKLVVYQTGTSHGIYSEGSATQTNYAFASRNSSGNDSWAIRYNGTTAISSDDRLKHNEKYITNALDVIKKIQPVKYFKTAKMFDENFNFEIDISGNPITSEDYHIESGLIAQEVKNIKELQYCVGGGETDISGNKQPYNLNYNDIFVYNIAATQELDKKVARLESENTELKAELAAIKAHLGI